MRPEHGGRLVLRLISGAPEVRYEVTLYEPAREWRGAARIALQTGAISFDAWPEGEPPSWLQHAARAVLRTLWRSALASDVQHWPARVTRWRAEPRAE